jgi:glutamate synthase domain-containing protein 3
VVEGTGDHGCEYMTGGTVVVLGRTGRNFAAGMSGGIAYVYDEDGSFASRCNTSMVSLGKILPHAEHESAVDRALWHRQQTDEEIVKALVADHHRWTGSLRAREILDRWNDCRGRFVKVFPNEYKRALQEISLKALTALGEIKGEDANAEREAESAIAKARGRRSPAVPSAPAAPGAAA